VNIWSVEKENEYCMEPELDLLAQLLELGFSAAAAIAGGFFIVLLIKYILDQPQTQEYT
jgi:hypothetical protein